MTFYVLSLVRISASCLFPSLFLRKQKASSVSSVFKGHKEDACVRACVPAGVRARVRVYERERERGRTGMAQGRPRELYGKHHLSPAGSPFLDIPPFCRCRRMCHQDGAHIRRNFSPQHNLRLTQ